MKWQQNLATHTLRYELLPVLHNAAYCSSTCGKFDGFEWCFSVGAFRMSNLIPQNVNLATATPVCNHSESSRSLNPQKNILDCRKHVPLRRFTLSTLRKVIESLSDLRHVSSGDILFWLLVLLLPAYNVFCVPGLWLVVSLLFLIYRPPAVSTVAPRHQ